MTVLKVWYEDHNSEGLVPNRLTEVPECICWYMGDVVFEDDNWIRLRFGMEGWQTDEEKHQVMNIRKCDITNREVISK